LNPIPPQPERGLFAWMVDNHIVPNLLMLFLLVGGLYMSTRIKQEVFPEFEEDMVTVSVAYPGASPEEVEQGIIMAVEEAIRGLDGVKEVTATATEGMAVVNAELRTDVDDQKVFQDVQQEINRITTLPEDAEEPQVTLATHRHEVMTVELYGDVSEGVLREVVEQVRDRLLQNPQITQVDVVGGRAYEIQVEVPQKNLRAYGLTLEAVAKKIKAASVELPGGKIETAGGEILLRIKDRRDWAAQFARIPIVATAGGTMLYLEDIAQVREGFEETDLLGFYNGKRSIGLAVYRVGDQTPIGVSDAVRGAMAEIDPDLPPGISWKINHDRSDIYRQRLELLLKNAFMGLTLVLLLLGLFLEFRLAFWVTMGIPTSFLGGLLFLSAMDISINMISMFAFIVALGIVVDDAIVAGENIYEYRNQGMSIIQAAVSGARDVAVPVTFSILTNVAAFLPLCFIPGVMGKIWRVIPLVVITVFLISWVESLLILPAHLAPRNRGSENHPGRLSRWQQRFGRLLMRFIENGYGPFLKRCLRYRCLTLAVGIFVLTVVSAYVLSGRIGMILMPRIESDRAVVTAVLPYGTPYAETRAVHDQLTRAVEQVAQQHGGDRLLEGIFSLISENTVEISAYLTDPDIRPLSTARLSRLWREQTGPIPGLESLRFESDRGGPGSGAALTIELSHRDFEVLDRASADLAEKLAHFSVVKDINDGFTPGKQQMDFRIRPEGESLGLTSNEVARQVRNAFYGAEALRQQRGRNEVKVMVRLPESRRISEFDAESLLIFTPDGRFVPLMQVAQVERGRSYTAINRRDGRRTVTVTADVEPIGETSRVMATLNTIILPQLVRDYPGLSYGYEGRQADMKESMQNLFGGFVLAMLAVYFLLAIPFRSYSQPLIVMAAIPFGIVGAVVGHLIMGYNLSLMSMMGVIALSGVVVNDSLILVDYANRRRRAGESARDAIYSAGIRRFRPIILTTLTTFGGLAPMIFETSRQARFMIPMALSLGYGIVFATLISLLVVPALYLVAEDLRQSAGIRKVLRMVFNRRIEPSPFIDGK
jgi:multidrug efflux pump subunit AcrB